MQEDQETSASIEINDENLMRHGEGPNPGPAIVVETPEETTKNPDEVVRVFQRELRRIRERRGKVLTGKLLGDIFRIIRHLDATIDGSEKVAISQHVVTSLEHTDVEVLSWVLTQDLSGVFANALSARIVERADGDERLQDPSAQISPMHGATEPGQAVHGVGAPEPASQLGKKPESPDKAEVRKEKELRPAEKEEQARRLAHLKAGINGIMHGKPEAFQDKEVMKALPGMVKQLYAKEKFGTAKQIIDRLSVGLSSEDLAMRAAVSESLSRSLDTVPPELRVHTTREVLDKLVSWAKSETSMSAAYKRTSAQLEKLARLLLGQREYGECIPILEAFYQARSERLQTDEALKTVASGVLDSVASQDIIELLVKDFQGSEEAKREQAARCLAMLGSASAGPLLDVLSETQDRSEQRRVVEVISEIGESAGPVLTRRMEQDGPWYLMYNLALLAGQIGNEDYLDPLAQLLSHEHVRVREEALNSICRIGGEHSGEILLSQLPLADDAFKAKLVAVLGAKRHHNAIRPLVELLETKPALVTDERIELEERICIALGQIGSEEAIPALKSIVGQKQFWSVKPFHKNVRAAAKKALEQIQAKQQSQEAA